MFVSVVTTVYNSLGTIDRCVDSVISQLPDECEYVLIDDGSTDGTGKHLEEKYGSVHNVRIIHQSNAGCAEAFNAAVAHSQGEYIINLDDDDYFFPETLAKLIDRLRKYRPDILQFWYKPYEKEGEFRNPIVFESETFLANREEMIGDNSPFRKRFSIVSNTWTCKAIRKELMAGIRATGPGKGADSLFIRQVLVRAESFLIFPLAAVALFEDPCSVSRSKDSDDFAKQNLERWLDSLRFFETEGNKNERPLLGADQIFYAYRGYCFDEIRKGRLNIREAKRFSKLIREKRKMIMPKPKKKTTAILNRIWLYHPMLAYKLTTRSE